MWAAGAFSVIVHRRAAENAEVKFFIDPKLENLNYFGQQCLAKGDWAWIMP